MDGKVVRLETGRKRHDWIRPDLSIVITVFALCIFGLVMVYSSSYYVSINETGDPSKYLIDDLKYELLGVIAMIVFSFVDYHVWIKIWPAFYLVGLGLLVVVLVAGASTNGAQRWIDFGSFTIMPGECAKVAMIVAFIGFFSTKSKWIANKDVDEWGRGLIIILGFTLLYVFLIMKQPNMSTAFTIIFIVGGMLFVAGTSLKKLLGLIGVSAILGTAYILKSSYRRARVSHMWDPFSDQFDTGYQVSQSLIALGSGGLKGLGLGDSVEKNLYLPSPHNDFILSVIGEELGYIGVLALMIVYVLLIWRAFRVALNAVDYEGLMLASGIAIMIAVQVLMNIAVVTAIMPPTGVILPFVSYGGTAMIVFMSSIGMLLNVSKSQIQ